MTFFNKFLAELRLKAWDWTAPREPFVQPELLLSSARQWANTAQEERPTVREGLPPKNQHLLESTREPWRASCCIDFRVPTPGSLLETKHRSFILSDIIVRAERNLPRLPDPTSPHPPSPEMAQIPDHLWSPCPMVRLRDARLCHQLSSVVSLFAFKGRTGQRAWKVRLERKL